MSVAPALRRWLASDRGAWIVLGSAMVASAALILWVTRGTTFYQDEFAWFAQQNSYQPKAILTPYNGELYAVGRLIYLTVLRVAGPEYVIFRLILVLSLALTVGVVFVWCRRRVDSVLALGPAIVLLFMGSAWETTVSPIGITPLLCVAAGVGALLALERNDLRGDAGACVLLIFSLSTYAASMAFVVAAAVYVLLREDRWERVWVFLVPLVLYGSWWLWALQFVNNNQPLLANVLLVPSYAASELATTLASVTGLAFDFGAYAAGGFPAPLSNSGFGDALALIALAALGWRVWRRGLPGSFWVALTALAAYWLSLTSVAGVQGRTPGQFRYTFVSAVVVFMAFAAAARGYRITRGPRIALYAVVAVSLLTNVALIRQAGSIFRGYAHFARSDLAMLELAKDRVSPAFTPSAVALNKGRWVTATAGGYLPAAASYGSPAFSVAEVRQQPEEVREEADTVLARALEAGLLAAASPQSSRRCSSMAASRSSGVPFSLKPPGVLIRVDGSLPASVVIGRFADTPTVSLGEVVPGRWTRLSVPADALRSPWNVFVANARSVTVCSGIRMGRGA